MNTRFEYLYRDDANYKRFGSVLLSGALTGSDRALIESKLEMGELFVAEQIGLPSLRDAWVTEEAALSREDNGWHWLLSISSVDDPEPTLMAASELVDRFRAVESWEPDGANASV